MTKRKSILSCIAWYNKNLRSSKTIIAKQGVFNVEFQQFCKTLDILSLNIYKIYYWCKFSFHWDDKTKDSVISLDTKSANHTDIIPEKENQLINSRKRDHILSFPLAWTPDSKQLQKYYGKNDCDFFKWSEEMSNWSQRNKQLIWNIAQTTRLSLWESVEFEYTLLLTCTPECDWSREASRL